MTKAEFMNNMTRAFRRTGLKIKKHSPEILLVTGVVGVVASAVMACKATTKLDAVLENAKFEVDAVHKAKENGEVKMRDPETKEIVTVEYTEQDYRKDIGLVYLKNAGEFAKLYGPSVLLGAVSIGCILAGHNIMRKRNAALAAAYTAVDTGFKEYRKRLTERFGEELDRELKYDIKATEVEETVVNEDGTEQTVKKTINVMNPNNYSPYAIVFDDGNPGWDKDPEITKYFLVQQQNWANEMLRSRGHLFLNEVYDMLGARRTQAGQVVGWVYDDNNEIGDNFVDFGIFDIYNPKACDFVNGYEKVIILDFNVDGDVMKLLK